MITEIEHQIFDKEKINVYDFICIETPSGTFSGIIDQISDEMVTIKDKHTTHHMEITNTRVAVNDYGVIEIIFAKNNFETKRWSPND